MITERKVLSDGFVRLVDVMGNDTSIVQAARVSYGEGTKTPSDDETLIRYLIRHWHTTPFEMVEFKFHVRVPMDCWRQWIRHRTACLAGDNILHFDLPSGPVKGGRKRYNLSVKDIYERFQPSWSQRPDKQRYQYNKRDNVQKMLLRNYDEDTNTVKHTNIVDIWESGVKVIYSVKAGIHVIRASEDHLVLTDTGWKKIKDLKINVDKLMCIGPQKNAGPVDTFPIVDYTNERWLPVVGWEDYYKVSSQGRIQRIMGGRGSQYGKYKKITVSDGRAVVSLNRPGFQETRLVSHIVIEAFKGPKTHVLHECCHNNGNSLDNREENLRWDTVESNNKDKILHNDTTRLGNYFELITDINKHEPEMTYDIEVEGPSHNFSCNGIVTHNSVNEYSTRYSEAIDSCDKAQEWREQSNNNKQGSSGVVDTWPDNYEVVSNGVYCNGKLMHQFDHEPTPAEYLSFRETQGQVSLRNLYQERLDFNVAREQARKDLPLSTYTEAYWKIDLHNLFHFLRLRLDSHAQYEIRQYAKAIFCIIQDIVPMAALAFEDYRLGAVTFSAQDIAYLRKEPNRLSKREVTELEAKCKVLGIQFN